MLGKLAILAIVWLVATAHVAPSKDIHVTGGLVEGTSEHGIRAYRGIPYAAPPVGERRWRAPQPVIPWNGVRLADQFADACPQGKVGADGKFGKDISEDCLYLNIWAPAKSAVRSLPVMVWIHGGGFRLGATSVPVYDGEALARHGVVVVSIAYRLGVFGFMGYPGQTSTNFGLLDQLAALNWVKRNIRAFGGNPRKITLFGESAGAMSVSLLVASPLAHGLFDGVIAESGAAFWPIVAGSATHGVTLATLAEAQAAGARLAQKLGAASIAQLRQVAAPRVVVAAEGVSGIGWPVADGKVIVGDQYRRYLDGRYNKTPVIVGINSDEGFSFAHFKGPADYAAEIRRLYGPYAGKLLDLYPPTPPAYPQSSMDLFRDAGFGWPAWTWARLQSRTGGPPVYVYYFDERPPYAAGSHYAAAKGVPHGGEVPFVFGHLDLFKLPWTRDDRDISDAMQRYWTNFAKHGNPNGKDLPHWPAFTVDKQQRMVFKGTPHTGSYKDVRGLNLLDEFFAWRREPGGKQ